jgi:hypothetical protein
MGRRLGYAGNLFMGDELGACIGIVMPNGNLVTIAGNGTSGYAGDGGPALNAGLGQVSIIAAVDAAGNIYISDGFNNAVRLLRPVSK